MHQTAEACACTTLHLLTIATVHPINVQEAQAEAEILMQDRGQMVQVGSQVCIRDECGTARFRIVDSADADAVSALVSANSPLGRALIGRRVGDLVSFRAPAGVLSVTVVEVA